MSDIKSWDTRACWGTDDGRARTRAWDCAAASWAEEEAWAFMAPPDIGDLAAGSIFEPEDVQRQKSQNRVGYTS